MVIYASKKFGSEKIVRTIVLSPIHVSRGEIFTFQAPARFGGKSHGYPDFKREKYNNKAESFFDLILMTTLRWITEKELEPEIKNEGDQFRWNRIMTIWINLDFARNLREFGVARSEELEVNQ